MRLETKIRLAESSIDLKTAVYLLSINNLIYIQLYDIVSSIYAYIVYDIAQS